MYSSKYIFVSVIAVCAYAVFADEGAHGGAPHAAPHGQTYEQPHQEYYSPPSYGGYQESQDPVIPNLYPAAVIGSLGTLGFMYFANKIDDSYNKSLYAFEALHHNVDHRLEHLEEMVNDDGKDNKKLDFKTKILCKFANLFNNPTYEICNQGFDAGQVVGPTGSGPNTGR